jgi:glycosyltransferase involved in cell wall biosynthesis
VIIGGSEAEIKARRSALVTAGVDEEAVRFLGLIPPDELPGWLAAADILMAPRKAGVNTPLKVLDYFKAGGAIVATDTPANRLIMDDRCARLVEFSPEGFAGGILALACDPAARGTIARKGRELYESRFNFRVFTRLLGEAYNDMLVQG